MQSRYIVTSALILAVLGASGIWAQNCNTKSGQECYECRKPQSGCKSGLVCKSTDVSVSLNSGTECRECRYNFGGSYYCTCSPGGSQCAFPEISSLGDLSNEGRACSGLEQSEEEIPACALGKTEKFDNCSVTITAIAT